jgi:Uma2 family endonuclease
MPAIPVPPRKRFTRDEVYCIVGAGILDGQRFELIDGELIEKPEQTPPHCFTIQLVSCWLGQMFGPRTICVRSPMQASGEDHEWSEPEPDLAVLAEHKPDYQHRHPRGDEMVLVAEVSDTSRAFDLSRKAEIYATAGVPEYWVVDLNRRVLVVHRQTDGKQYRQIQVLGEEEMASIQGRLEKVKVGDLLPVAE